MRAEINNVVKLCDFKNKLFKDNNVFHLSTKQMSDTGSVPLFQRQD